LRAFGRDTGKMYKILYTKAVAHDLKNLHVYKRKHILDDIDKQLMYEPTVKTKHRKPVFGLIPPWERVEPIWELSIGEYRVFYDVDDKALVVNIRAIRHKPPHKTTEEIL
jgi:mRNA-degrading endonuclease RelE of RelBE toxin-antitoxin system